MKSLFLTYTFLFLFAMTGARGQSSAQTHDQLSLHWVNKILRYHNAKIVPGGSGNSVLMAALQGHWTGAASVAPPESMPLAGLFNRFDSVVPLPDYRREWFYPEGELVGTAKTDTEAWRTNSVASAGAKYYKSKYGLQTAKIEQTRTWVTAGEPVDHERTCFLWIHKAQTVDSATATVEKRVASVTIPANDVRSSAVDLKPGLLTKQVDGVSVETSFAENYSEEASIAIFPLNVVSRDRFLGGSIVVSSEWESLEMELVGADGSLGKYGKLLGGGTTKIHPTVRDILSEADYAAGTPVNEQKVWFVKNATDPRRIDFYTCFESLGEIQIKLYVDGRAEPVGEIPHLLKAEAEMGAWIEYADQWVKGTLFPWEPGVGGPPVLGRPALAGRSSAMASIPDELDNLSRACLIPVFLAVESVEGMSALLRGMFDGVKAGALDDWALIYGAGYKIAEGIDWSAENASYQLNLFVGDPKWRATYFYDIAVSTVEEYVFRPMREEGGKLSSWDNMAKTVMDTGSHLFKVAGDITGEIRTAMKSWFDDFNNRMMQGAEKVSWSNTPWNGDIFFAGAANLTVMNYTVGYSVGYMCEQIAAGKGIATAGKVLLRGGVSLAGKLATRTTFAVGTRMHLVKKAVQGGAASLEMKWVIEQGFARSAREPVMPLVVPHRRPFFPADAIEKGLQGLKQGREAFNLKSIIDDLFDSPNIRKLTKTAQFGEHFANRVATLFKVLDSAATEKGMKGFKMLYERSLWFDASDAFMKDHFDELMRVFRPTESAARRSKLNAALEQYSTMNGSLDDDLSLYCFLSNKSAEKLVAAGEHPAVAAFTELVKNRAPEIGKAVSYAENATIVRFERKIGKSYRRLTETDIPGNELREAVDFVNVDDLNDKIDIKGPIMTTGYPEPAGFFENYAQMTAERLNLGNSAVKKIKKNNFELVPPLPTTVVIDTFGLTTKEIEIIRGTITRSGLDPNLFKFLDDL
ncbi:MAG: hypothetical protein EOP88_05500 [Verrucomicrobiaceae bacterium]|nr:MAG: hypothetical protein EOP88_05500 [Verrucomicrobiaceae bacterium]